MKTVYKTPQNYNLLSDIQKKSLFSFWWRLRWLLLFTSLSTTLYLCISLIFFTFNAVMLLTAQLRLYYAQRGALSSLLVAWIKQFINDCFLLKHIIRFDFYFYQDIVIVKSIIMPNTQ